MRPMIEAMAELNRIAQSEPVKTLAQAFAEAGYEIALVGGPVRDAMLGRAVKDLDFTTSAKPEQTKEVLAKIASKTWDLGRDFGTIAARIKGHTVEVTTYRAEVYRDDSRKPTVTYGDTIEEDLKRRDFTVNAIALMLPKMRLVDISGGIEHLLSGVIDTPAVPESSFTDDPLRMLRAARFAAQLGFQVADRVLQAMAALADRLEIISQERIRDELIKLLTAKDPVTGLRLLVATGLAAKFLPELSALQHTQDDQNRHKDVYEHSLTVLQQAIDLEQQRWPRLIAEKQAQVNAAADGDSKTIETTKNNSAEGGSAQKTATGTEIVGECADFVLRLAAVLHDIGKPATRKFESGTVTFYNHDVVGAKLTKKRLRALRFDNDTIKRVARLVELHMRFFGYSDAEWTDSAVRRYVRDAGDQLEQLHIITRADVTTRNKQKANRLARAYDELENRIAQLAAQEELDAVRPELNGDEIMQILGIKPGREVGMAYKFLLNLRLDEGELGRDEVTRRLLSWWQEQN